jgi:hypothetical protein
MRGDGAKQRPNRQLLSDRKDKCLGPDLGFECQSIGQADLMPTLRSEVSSLISASGKMREE